MTRIAGSPCLHLGTLSRLLSRPHARTGLAAGWRAPVLIALSSTLAAVPVLARTSHDFSGVEQRMAKEVEDGNVPSLALAIAKDGKIVHVTDAPSADKHLAEMKDAVAKLKG